MELYKANTLDPRVLAEEFIDADQDNYFCGNGE